jgi:hypothetical protein
MVNLTTLVEVDHTILPADPTDPLSGVCVAASMVQPDGNLEIGDNMAFKTAQQNDRS